MAGDINWEEFERLPDKSYENRRAWLRENVPGYAESQDKYSNG